MTFSIVILNIYILFLFLKRGTMALASSDRRKSSSLFQSSAGSSSRRKDDHLLHAIVASVVFMAIWTPYRYVTPFVISKGISILVLDSFVKPAVKIGIVFSCLRFLDEVPKGRYLEELGVKREGLVRGIILGTLSWFSYTSVWQYSALCVLRRRISFPSFRLTVHLSEYFTELCFYILIVGFFEEILARGYIFRELYRGIKWKFNLISSLLVTGCIFSLFHVPIDVFVSRMGGGQLAFHLLFVFSFSILAGFLFFRSGWQIVSVTIFHGLMDTTPFFSLLPPDVQLGGAEGLTISYFLSFTTSALVIEIMHRAMGRIKPSEGRVMSSSSAPTFLLSPVS